MVIMGRCIVGKNLHLKLVLIPNGEITSLGLKIDIRKNTNQCLSALRMEH